MVTIVKIPPDGGYGWVIVIANALSNLIIIPMIQSFGLIFKDIFVEMGLSATEGSLIINLNAAFGMIMGLLNGVLLKLFGYRKIAMAAAVLITVGIIMTSFAKTFTHFIVAYGLITSLGFGLNMSAYSLALNCYFRKKKGKAVAYAMTITGLGPILMPQVINILTQIHTVQGVTLILAAIAAHSFVAATLLQPIKWHLKTKIIEDEIKPEEAKEEEKPKETKPVETKLTFARSISQVETTRQQSVDSISSVDNLENGPIYGMDSAFNGSVISIHSAFRNRKDSIISQSWKKSSIHSLAKAKDNVYPELSRPIKKKKLFDRIVNFFDLDLLKDPIYCNILIGLSLAVFAEINFSLLTPFILADFGLDTNQIATFLSVLGIADIIFRFLAPYIENIIKLPAREMYMLTLFLLMISRFSLLISQNYLILLGVSLGLGIAKGIRTVYMSLVIPMYVPIEKLASASGLQMMVNGLCILIGGPIIGFIRDVTGNYTLCIIVLNFITLSTILLWTTELIILKFKKKPEAPKEQLDTLLNKTLGMKIWCRNLSNCHDNSQSVDFMFKKWREEFKKSKILEAEESIGYILAHILGTTKISDVYMLRNKILSKEEIEKLEFLCKKRLIHMPLQYVLEEWSFRSLTLKMSPPVFIPRPETEQLVDFILPEITPDCNILDLCSGSGAIALSLLHENPTVKATTVDQSKAACELTKENAQRNNLNNRLTIIHSRLDCYKCEEKFDIIVSNPPYIFTEDLKNLQFEIKLYEDLRALNGGDVGLDVIKTILDISWRCLCENGKLFLEIEPRHPRLLEDYLKKYNGLRLVEIYSDFNNKQRFVKINKTL